MNARPTTTTMARQGESGLALKTQARTFLETIAPDLKTYLAEKKGYERFALNAISEIMSQKKLLTNPSALGAALVKAARYHLTLGREANHCAIVPYYNKDTKTYDLDFQVMVQGMIYVAIRSGIAKIIRADVPYANDKLEINLNDFHNPIRHSPAFGERGASLGAYAVALLPNDLETAVWLDVKHLQAVERCARGTDKPNSPWRRFKTEMWKKVAVRNLMKYLTTMSADGLMDEPLKGVIAEDNDSYDLTAPALADGPEAGNHAALTAMEESDGVIEADEIFSFPVFGGKPVAHDTKEPPKQGPACPVCKQPDVWDAKAKIYRCAVQPEDCSRSAQYVKKKSKPGKKAAQPPLSAKDDSYDDDIPF